MLPSLRRRRQQANQSPRQTRQGDAARQLPDPWPRQPRRGDAARPQADPRPRFDQSSAATQQAAQGLPTHAATGSGQASQGSSSSEKAVEEGVRLVEHPGGELNIAFTAEAAEAARRFQAAAVDAARRFQAAVARQPPPETSSAASLEELSLEPGLAAPGWLEDTQGIPRPAMMSRFFASRLWNSTNSGSTDPQDSSDNPWIPPEIPDNPWLPQETPDSPWFSPDDRTTSTTSDDAATPATSGGTGMSQEEFVRRVVEVLDQAESA